MGPKKQTKLVKDPSNIDCDDEATSPRNSLSPGKGIKIGSCVFLGVQRKAEVLGPVNHVQSPKIAPKIVDDSNYDRRVEQVKFY